MNEEEGVNVKTLGSSIHSAPKLLNKAFSFYIHYLPTIVGICSIPFIIYCLSIFIKINRPIIFVVSFLAASFLTYLALLVMVAKGERSIFRVYKTSFTLFFTSVWIEVLVTLVILGGLFLFVIPGIFLSALLPFSLPILLVDRKHGMSALVASWSLVREHRGEIIARIAFLSLGIILIEKVFLSGNSLLLSILPYTGTIIESSFEVIRVAVLVFLIGPMSTLYTWEMYLSLKEVKKSDPSTQDEFKIWRKLFVFSLVGVVSISALSLMAEFTGIHIPWLDAQKYLSVESLPFNTGLAPIEKDNRVESPLVQRIREDRGKVYVYIAYPSSYDHYAFVYDKQTKTVIEKKVSSSSLIEDYEWNDAMGDQIIAFIEDHIVYLKPSEQGKHIDVVKYNIIDKTEKSLLSFERTRCNTPNYSYCTVGIESDGNFLFVFEVGKVGTRQWYLIDSLTGNVQKISPIDTGEWNRVFLRKNKVLFESKGDSLKVYDLQTHSSKYTNILKNKRMSISIKGILGEDLYWKETGGEWSFSAPRYYRMDVDTLIESAGDLRADSYWWQ